MKSNPKDDGVLERNVSTLLEGGGEPPRIADGARARIRAQLIADHGVDARKRSPLIAVGLGLAATAVAAVIVTRVVGGEGDPPAPIDGGLADGTSWVTAPGATVDVVAARRVRVRGAALLDVAPGTPFVVETARGTIEVLGTRFLVDAGADRTTAAVVRGSVQLASSDGRVVLHAGEQGIAEPGRPPSRGPAPRLSHLVSWAAQARRRDEHEVRPLRNGTLFAREPNNPSVPESPLPITKLVVDVVVEDQVARVALDQTFRNPQPRVMEGMYRFAIPPDASLQRLAMYVNGTLTESAVVERMAARRIYEDVVYRRLDPALLEWAGTGRLALRVYPLPPREDKRLVVAYTQSLPKLYDDWTLRVPLPEIDLPVGEVGFAVRVKGCANCELTSTSHRVEVAREGDDAIVTYRQRAVTIGDSLVVHVRDPRDRPVAASYAAGGDRFLLVRARPDLAAAARPYRPRTWVIVDDVSASRGPLELRAQADLVDAFVRELDEDDRIAVIAFDVAARTKLAPTRVMDVDRTAVRAALKDEGGVGATSFAAALDAATALLAGVAPDDAMIVYLGDGVITSGARDLDALRAQLAGKAQFVGVGVGDGPDTQTLDALAAATGGYATTIDLADDVGWRAFDLVAALHTARVTGLEARLVDAAGALVPAAVYVATPQLADGEQLELVAKLAGPPASAPVAVELTGRSNGAPWRQRVALAAAPPPVAEARASYLPRLWAQRHIAARLLAKHEPVAVPPCEPPKSPRGRVAPPVCSTEGELRDQRDEAIRREVVALGKRYFVLSRHTSLLVLEDDAMYKRYGVTKGAGETWAPYAVPAKIPVAASPIPPVDVVDDAELERSPLQVFADPGYADGLDGLVLEETRQDPGRGRDSELSPFASIEEGLVGGVVQTRRRLHLVPPLPSGPRPREPWAAANKTLDDGNVTGVETQEDKAMAWAGPATVVTTETLSGTVGWGVGHGYGAGRGRALGGKRAAAAGPVVAMRFTAPGDAAYDDLTAFVPALQPDAATAWRRELAAAAGGATRHPIDDAARALLVRARAALPSGIYRWGDHEIAVDGARRIGWRSTTDADLAETASFDGTTWTRRYAELGLDVTRALAEDDLALALAYLPIWIADPAHYARWFEVHAAGRQITLARAASRQAGKPEVVLVLAFDDRDRLVAIERGDGTELVRITWGDTGPTAARIHGDAVSVGFTGQPITDAPAWAHAGASPGIVVELPGRLPAYWAAKLAKLAPGSAAWRHVARQHMVALAATADRAGLFAAYEALREAGGVERGDLVVAGTGIVTGTRDVQVAAALAPHRPRSLELVQYFEAGRAFAADARLERIRPRTTAGLVGALWSLREVVALARANQGTRAVDRLLALGSRAFQLRLIGAAILSDHGTVKAADAARAWDAVAVGEYRNIARVQAAQLFANRGDDDAVAERIAKLVADLDLAAAPPQLAHMQWPFQRSRRGQAGWQLVWATWRDRALASDSFDHVIALMAGAAQHPNDVPAILARAARLAAGDPDRIAGLAQLAIDRGQAAWAESIVEPLVKARPTRALHQLAARLAVTRSRPADALAHLEAAQALGGDEAVALATVRAELAQILQLARQLAVQSTGAERQVAVTRALGWAGRWRLIDPGNAQIDQTLGELLLAVGDQAEAWRQLSSVIERDPMSGDGYQTVADAFERQGRVAEAIAYWQQAIAIDQTNPTPRIRKAQALIALGRTGEGDAVLAEIAGRRWHARHDGVVDQVRSMIERAKQRR